MKKLPFMPFYGTDFYESERVRLMSRVQRDIYLELLWHQWREGSLPASAAAVASLIGADRSQFPPEMIDGCFPVGGEDGRRRNARLEAIRQEQEAIRRKKSEGGRAGRAKQLGGDTPGIPRGEPGDSPASQSQSQSQITTNYDDAHVRGYSKLAEAMDEMGRSALQGYRRASRDPGRLLAELEALVSGLHGPGGQPVPATTLGRALHEMAIADARMTAKALTAFVRRAMEPDRAPRTDALEDEGAAWIKRKEQEIARKEAAKNGHA
jgi:hypothetical protein